MGDFEKRSELSQIATDVFRKHNMEHYLQDEQNIISSRFTKVLQKLEKHMGERCVVFSTFRTVTDLLMSLIEKSRPVFTISAASSIKQRRKLISDFEESENGVLVIPYDIGAEGLNLQCASAVFLVDLWWNTAKTNQAIGRVFRQGQKAEKIHVYFFVSNTVVENTIIRKGKMKEQILSELMTGTCNLNAVPKIPLKDIVKMISLENNVDEISSLRDKKM
jgi:SNF2 family DNA or RNA helicase